MSYGWGLGHVIFNLHLGVGHSVLCQMEGVGHVFSNHHILKCSGPPLVLFDQSLTITGGFSRYCPCPLFVMQQASVCILPAFPCGSVFYASAYWRRKIIFLRTNVVGKTESVFSLGSLT